MGSTYQGIPWSPRRPINTIGDGGSKAISKTSDNNIADIANMADMAHRTDMADIAGMLPELIRISSTNEMTNIVQVKLVFLSI